MKLPDKFALDKEGTKVRIGDDVIICYGTRGSQVYRHTVTAIHENNQISTNGSSGKRPNYRFIKARKL